MTNQRDSEREQLEQDEEANESQHNQRRAPAPGNERQQRAGKHESGARPEQGDQELSQSDQPERGRRTG